MSPPPWSHHVLQPGDVLCFGSNWNFRRWEGGFHGMGAALFALCGPGAEPWRTNPEFRALQDTAARRGAAPGAWWASLGVGFGPSSGARGQSLAIPTVTRAGARRSIPLLRGQEGHPDSAGWSLQDSLELLRRHLLARPDETFVSLRLATGLAGYRTEEMERVWNQVFAQCPPNLIRAELTTVSPALLRGPDPEPRQGSA